MGRMVGAGDDLGAGYMHRNRKINLLGAFFNTFWRTPKGFQL